MATAPTPTPVPPAQRRLTTAERYELVAQVRLSYHYQRTLWEVIRNGIALGAEEVQDQRLLAAETPPEANPALDAFVFFLMWAVEGPLVATLVAGVQRMVVNGLQRQMRLQSRAYRQLIATEAQARPALDEARRIAATRTQRAQRRREAASEGGASRERRARDATERSEAAQSELRRLEARQFPSAEAMNARSELRQTALALQGIRQADLPDYIVAVPNVALQQSITFSQPTPDAGVSPGVTLRAQVDTRALELIQDSYLQQELYELKLNLLGENITAGDAAELFEDIGVHVPVNVAAVLDHYRLATAAIIWAQLLGTVGLRARRLREADARARTLQAFAGDPIEAGGQLFTTPEPNQSYLIARFGDAAEAWARRAPQDVLLPGFQPRGQQTPQAVEDYLQAGRGTAPQGIMNAVRQSLGLDTDPSMVRLDLVLQWLSALAQQTTETLVL